MRQPDFSTFPELETDRLLLRQLSAGDVTEIYQLRSDIEVATLTGKEPFTSLDDAFAYINKIRKLIDRNECIFWGISYKDSRALIGAICLWNFDIPTETVEIGYELLAQFQNRGIMAEVVPRILDYGFKVMGVKTVVAFPSSDNPRSIKLLEKMGFKPAPGNYKHTHINVSGMLIYTFSSPTYPSAI